MPTTEIGFNIIIKYVDIAFDNFYPKCVFVDCDIKYCFMTFHVIEKEFNVSIKYVGIGFKLLFKLCVFQMNACAYLLL